MWLHGLGFLLPKAMEVALLYVVRNDLHHSGAFLHPCRNPPLALGRERCFRHLCFSGPPSPMGATATPEAIRRRHHPPSGLQLWPGHSLQLHLRIAWRSPFQPAAEHWPRDWSAHLRTWHMQPCPHQQFQWKTSSWTLAAPVVFKPVQVYYHAVSGHAEWIFDLKER